MSGNPKLFVSYLLVANDGVSWLVYVDDGGQLFHFVTLRIDSADVVERVQRFRKVELTHVNKWFRRH